MAVVERKERASEAYGLQLCIFDERRGENEGDEMDKILAYYPSSTAPNMQAWAVGLAQAILTFSSTFKPVDYNHQSKVFL